MAFALSRRAEASDHRLAVFDTIGSTSEEAMTRARSGEGGPLWLVTSEQTAGRGRRGKAWQTARGNLAASLLLTGDLSPAMVAQLGFVAGVAVIGAFKSIGRPLAAQAEVPSLGEPRSPQHRCTPFKADLRPPPHEEDVGSLKRGFPSFALKWPNDVLADGRKLVGILLQTEVLCSGRRAIVIGIGINVRHVPEGVAYPTTSLHALGLPVGADAVFETLSEAWIEAMALWDEGRGFAAVRQAWLAQAAGIGGEVAVRLRDDLMRGRFETIDEHGQLVVRARDGSLRRVSAGDVQFGAAATVRAEAHP